MVENAADLLEAIRTLAPSIRARSAEIESLREVPRDLLDELTRAGCFRMFVPRSHGGLEISLAQSLRIFEELARADAATGWVVMIASEGAQLFGQLPRRRFDAMYSQGPDVIGAGSATPGGEAKVTADGYVVSGRWPFASGCLHSKWLVANCVVTKSGAPRPGPIPGLPEVRAMLLPTEKAKILDTWFVAGMRGTGSHDFEVKDLHVAADDSLDFFLGQPCVNTPLFVAPAVQFCLHIAAVGIGIAQSALDDVIALAKSHKRRLFAKTTLAESPVFQHRIGESEASLRAARALLNAEAEEFWELAASGNAISPAQRSKVGAAGAWVAQTAAGVVDACYSSGGGTALYDTSPLQRHLRDIHTLTQHFNVADGWLTQAGAALLGLEVGFGL